MWTVKGDALSGLEQVPLSIVFTNDPQHICLAIDS
jgi:hypothetical protein